MHSDAFLFGLAFTIRLKCILDNIPALSKINPGWKSIFRTFLKAILQVLIYKALYDYSYLESKTTMTSCEWSCLISFTRAPLICSERRGSEKFKMKIYGSSGIRTHTAPVHDRKVSALDSSATLVRYQVKHYSLTVFWNGYVTIPVWNRLWFDTQCKVL